MSEIADRYRRIAAGFTARVEAVPPDRWAAPSPCEGWDARDVVRHVVSAHGTFEDMVGRSIGEVPSVDADPLAAWAAVRDRVQARLQLVPPHDPQFRRNRERVIRDAERENLLLDWDLGEPEGDEA